MDDLNRLTIKTFRGGISADEDKGPVGAFRYGQGLNIHEGQDSLKCNQKLKADTLGDGEAWGDLPLVIVPASDGNKFAFGDTGKIYRKKAGEWVEMYDMSSKISGAVEYESSTGIWLLFGTVTTLYKILLRHASNLDDWTDRIIEVGDFKGAAELTPTFKVTYGASKYGFIMKGILNPSGTVPPELLASAKANASSGSTTISANITVPNKPNLQMIIITGTYNSIGVSGVTVGGNAATGSGGSGSAGAFNIGWGIYKYTPTAGAVTVTTTFASSATNRFIYVFICEGVDQTTPLASSSGDFPVSIPDTSIETTLAETADNQFRFCLFAAEQTTFTPQDGQTLILTANTGSAGTEGLYYRMPFITEDNTHTAKKALGDAIFCDGQRLALYDYQDSFNNEALTLPDGTNGSVILDYSDEGVARVAVVAQSSSGSLMITWDGISDSWLTKKTLKSSEVFNMGFLEGGILALTENGSLKYWNFSDAYPFKEVPGIDSGLPGGVSEFKGKSHFGWSGDKGGIYSVGRNDKSRPIAINLEYLPSPVLAGDATQADMEYGALASDGEELYVSWRYYDAVAEGYVAGMDIVDPDNKAPAIYESLKMDGGRPESEKGYKQIKVVAETIPTGCSIVAQYRSTRLSGSEEDGWNDAEMSDGGTAMVAGDTKGVFDIEAYGEEYETRLQLNPSGNNTPEVKSVTTFFDFDNDL